MHANDTLHGRLKNGVLTISGNNASIRVEGGCLVVRDGPNIVPPDHRGKAPPVEQRMTTVRFTRAEAASGALSRIIITRPDGFITFAAQEWLHGVGCGISHLKYDGTVVFASGPTGPDRSAIRRVQASASGNDTGLTITREVLRAKLRGQAEVARLLGNNEVGELITTLGAQADAASDLSRLLTVEAMAATAYWPLWQSLPLRFARQHATPEHWRIFGTRHSPLSGKPFKAASPGNAILNYLYAVSVSEMTIALTGTGLDPGIGIFHADTDRRASLAYDALEALRPYVDNWFVSWLATAHFSKRDFYEEVDGTVRLTRPLTSHLAMTAAIWRPVAQAVAGWLARALLTRLDGQAQLLSLPALPAPKRTWQGSEPPLVRTCHECGRALAPTRRKFCSETCAVAFHLATTTAEAVSALPNGAASKHGSGDKSRRHLALRRAWDSEHSRPGRSSVSRTRNTWTTASGPAVDQLREWFIASVSPLLAKRPIAEIRLATGLSTRYVIMIRQGLVPHPRHYGALAAMVGKEVPVIRVRG